MTGYPGWDFIILIIILMTGLLACMIYAAKVYADILNMQYAEEPEEEALEC